VLVAAIRSADGTARAADLIEAAARDGSSPSRAFRDRGRRERTT
jgi:hypothetical protein